LICLAHEGEGLTHAGIETNQPVLESGYSTVADIRQLRVKIQAMAQQVIASRSSVVKGEGAAQMPE